MSNGGGPGRRGPQTRSLSQAIKGIDKKTFGRLMQYIGEYKVRFILVVLFILFSSIASVASSMFLGELIDDYIAPLLQAETPDYTPLLLALVKMGVIYLIGILSAYFYNRIMVTISQGILKKVRDQMFSHMQTLPIKYFDTHAYGDIMSRYTNDTDAMRGMLSQSLPQCISSVISIIVVFISMIMTSLWLTLFILVFAFLMLKISGFVAGKSGAYFIRQQQATGNVNAFIEEMINGQKVIKVFTHEEQSKADFDKRNDELCEVSTKGNIFSSILGPINNNLGYILYALLALIGGTMAIRQVTNVSLSGVGVLTLGNIATFLQLSRSFINPINSVSQQLNMIVMALAGATRIFELIDEESEQDAGYVTLVNIEHTPEGEITESEKVTGEWAWKHPHSESGKVDYTLLQGDVTFDHVDFAYVADKIVLHDITLFAKPGQKVALVGATGAGKTTITNLINRFYDIADGKVRYDGININKIAKPDLRKSLGVVLQDVNLFTGTVMDNIRYGKLDATDEECIAAAKLANADAFINMLPEGYNTMLEGDGSNLSQGQRQLLSIARAAVANPPVMILDEATSSIDTRTEAIVQKGMDALMQGRTVFVIAHRLSTVQNADVIMVLDHGNIIERGTHEELLEKHGEYYQLYTGAFELE